MSARDSLLHSDRIARRAAQTRFDGPVVVEAGAGTGKTAVLVARIVVWSLGPGWEMARSPRAATAPWVRTDDDDEALAGQVLERVVAITFTEAAAAEMASRVGEALAAVHAGAPPPWLDPGCLPGDATALRVRSRALIAALDRLQISTIHAYCRRLLARYPLEAGLHPGFEVDAELEAVAEAAEGVVEQALPRLYGDPADPAALALAAEGFGPGDLAEALGMLAERAVPATVLERDPFSPETCRGLCDEATRAVAAFLAGAGANLRRTATSSGLTHRTLERLESLRRHMERAGGSLEAFDGLCLELASLPVSGEIGRLRDWARGKLNSSEKAVALGTDTATAAAEVWTAVDTIRGLRPVTYNNARRVLHPLLAETEAVLRRRGVVPFQRLLLGARDLFAAHPEVCRSERERITQLLVDEFQDTDTVQCDLLRSLVLGDGPSPSLFLVGDPKQSIYGWRSADLKAYECFLADILGDRAPFRLSVSFRSVPPILAEVEKIVRPIMVAEAGMQPPFEPLEACAERALAAPFAGAGRRAVEHWVCWDRDSGSETSSWRAVELEAEAIAADIASLHRGSHVAWRDVAVLLRTSSELPEVLEALKRHGVPFAVQRDRSYFRRREVIEAAAVVRLIVDPLDQVALLTALRSVLAGVPDAALVPLWRRNLPELQSHLGRDRAFDLQAFEDLVRAAAAEIPGDIPGLGRVAGWEESLLAFLEALARLRVSFAADPGDRFVELLRTLTLAEPLEAARFLGAFRLANLERFFRRLAAALEESSDPVAVLRFLRSAVRRGREEEEGRPGDMAGDAVAVMTVHRAKGLDFPHVYVAQVHRGSRPDATARVDAEELDGVTELVLLGAVTPGWRRVRERRARVAEAELVRTLYVATTRARERLVLSGGRGARHSGISFGDLLGERPGTPDLADLFARGEERVEADGVLWVFPALAPAKEAAVASHRDLSVAPTGPATALLARRAEAAARAARPLRETASEAAHRLLDDGVVTTGAGAAAAAATGTALHRFFELFDLDGDVVTEIVNGRLRVRDELLLAPEVGGEAAASLAAEVLDGILDGPLWPRFLALRGRIVGRELPVVLPARPEDGALWCTTGVIDLVYRDAGDEIVVADFKSDAVAGIELDRRAAAYALQGKVYVEALRQALSLPKAPRFELWFLRAGIIVTPPMPG